MTKAEMGWFSAAIALAALACALGLQRSSALEQTHEALTRLAAVRERANELERVARTTRARAPDSTADAPAQKKTPSTETKATDVQQTLRAAREAVEAAQRKMYSDPEARAILNAAEKARVRSTHPDLARVLQLSPEEEDRLLQVIAEQDVRQRERYAVTRDFGAFDFEDMQRTREPEHMAVLGAQKYALFKRYSDSLPERLRVRKFVAQLGERDRLQDEAAERLIVALAAERKAREENEKQSTGEHLMWMTPIQGVSLVVERGDDGLQKAAADLEDYDRRRVAAAAAVLSPSQLRQFTRYLERLREASLANVAESLEE
jgi:hypothetical protein